MWQSYVETLTGISDMHQADQAARLIQLRVTMPLLRCLVAQGLVTVSCISFCASARLAACHMQRAKAAPTGDRHRALSLMSSVLRLALALSHLLK